MARHIDFRDHGDVAAPGVIHDGRIVSLAVVSAGRAAHLQAAAKIGQVRPRLDLDAPALVIREVDMQPVDLVIGQQVDVLGDILDAEKVPGHVQHGPAPGEARGVGDRARLHDPRPRLDRGAVDARRQQLSDGLDAVEQAGRLVGDDLDLLRGDG